MAFDLKGDFKVPVVGEVPKVLVLGGGLVVGVLVFVHFRNSSSGSAAAASSPASGTDPYPPDGTVGNPGDPNSTDPATGETYGDEQAAAGDTAAGIGDEGDFGDLGAGLGDEYPWDGTTGNPNDPYSLDPSSGETYGDEGDFGGSSEADTGGPPFVSNAAWDQYAEQYLTSTVGLDSGTVSDALGLYLDGSKVTTAQQQIIEEALGIAGNPPVAGTNGMPPGINVSGSSTGGTGPQTKVPNVVGMRGAPARQALRAAGFTTQTTGASQGTVSAQKPAGNTKASQGSLVTITIRALGSSGGGGGTVKVPNLIGMQASQARQALTSLGLKYTEKTTGKIPAGSERVVSGQSRKAGSTADKGITVALTEKAK